MAAPGPLAWVFGEYLAPPVVVGESWPWPWPYADPWPSPWPSQIAQLLPPSAVLWDMGPTSKLRGFLEAIGFECERIRRRNLDLIEESDPRTATETIENWEQALGLPDDQVPVLPTTLPERRAVVVAKLTGRAGQNYDFFEALCLSCGYPLVSITNPQMMRVGARVGDRVYGAAYVYTMILTLGPAPTGAMSHADFERVIRAATHSHIVDIFVYT